ncbi:MAG: protein-L-isoaspartate(D-aspartate) O-methyltransferase [Candidatus Omnitrophota bacterium]|nr:protein-L-isoaspartate(D-aspartate) O-methyltransferase [Candidatus Omnitrophota bacterium]
MEEINFDKLRQLMVDNQIIARGIRDERVISAFYETPRHKFVPENIRQDSYEDCPLPIGNGQTISQPYIVALMTESLRLKPTDRVLEIGTGSGYQAAILSKLCSHVYTIERMEALQKKAEETFRGLGILNISTKVGDGTLGWEEFSPYDAIIVTAAADNIPEPLINELNESARLIIPVGAFFGQILTLLEKNKGKVSRVEICGCTFVPLVGKYGHKY